MPWRRDNGIIGAPLARLGRYAGPAKGAANMAEGTRKSMWDAATTWNRRVWRRWIVSHLLFGGVSPRRSSVPPPPDGTDGAADPGAGAARPTVPAPSHPDVSTATELIAERRYDARARLEALTDRFVAVEQMLDVMHRRLALREQQERRSEARLADLLERAAETAERQGEVLKAVTLAQERIEQRLERIEQRVSRAPETPPGYSTASSMAPATTPSWEGAARGEAFAASRFAPARAARPPDMRSSTEPPGHGSAPTAGPHPAFHGSLTDMSLPTLLAMFELERRTGRLTVAYDFEEPISFLLNRGRLASSSSFGAEMPHVEALRRAMKWTDGEFWFDPVPATEPPNGSQQISALLMEVSRQEDEATRAG